MKPESEDADMPILPPIESQPGGLLSIESQPGGSPLSSDVPYTFQSSLGVAYYVLRFANYGFQCCFIRLPFYVMLKIPRSDSLLSFIFTFYFLQMLGYVWLLIVAVITTCSVKLTHCLDEWPSTCMDPLIDGSTSVVTRGTAGFASLVTMYVYYCTMRVLFFGSRAVYDFSWESFQDFPTIRKLLVDSLTARMSSKSGAVVSEVHHDSSKRAIDARVCRQLQAQRVTLIFPLCFLTLSYVVLTCISFADAPNEALAPHGRVQRISRFTLMVAFFQWMSQYALLFPRWHEALMVTNKKVATMVGVSILVVICRVLLWASRLEELHTMFGFSLLNNPTVECAVFSCCAGGMMYCVFKIVGDKKVLKITGYDPRSFEDEVIWRDRIIMFKYGLVVGGILHFARGVVLPHIGYVNAHNDFIVYSILCPSLLTLIWSTTFTLSQLRFSSIKSTFCWTLVCLIGGHFICSLSPITQDHFVLKVFVAIHLIRQVLKRKTCRRQSRGNERQRTIHLSLLRDLVMLPLIAFLVTFCFTLVGLSVVSRFQERYQYFFPTIRFNSTDSDVQVDHLISRLHLSATTEEVEDTLPKYAVCTMRDDLSALDYALLSMVSYFEAHDVERVMEGFFPKRAGLPWKMGNFAHGQDAKIVWYEFYFPTLNKTVITVRGTDASKLADYVEDIRLWSEPTSMTLLGLFVPTVRIWSKSSTEMIIFGLHETMSLLGLYDNEWNYVPLLDYVRSFPAEADVVLTGHSMGGSMASIVAVLAGRKVFAVQPPGIYHSIAKHQKLHNLNTHRWLHHEQTTIIVEGDWVNNAFDEHGGMVQRIGCEHQKMAFLLGCHMIEGTVCHLLKHCGDPRRRWNRCTTQYQSPLHFGAEVIWNFATQTNFTELSGTLETSIPRLGQLCATVLSFTVIYLGFISMIYYGF